MTLVGLGFDTTGQYRCTFTSQFDTSRVLYSPTTTASTATTLSCTTPAFGLSYPAETVTLTLERNTNSSNSDAHFETINGVAMEFTFEVHVAGISVPSDNGAMGGSNMIVTAPGLDYNRSTYTCVFNDTQSSAVMYSTSARGISLDTIECETPAWGLYHCESTVNVSVFQNTTSLEPDAGNASIMTYYFFPVLDEVVAYPNAFVVYNVTPSNETSVSVVDDDELAVLAWWEGNGGAGAGGEAITVHGYGLCERENSSDATSTAAAVAIATTSAEEGTAANESSLAASSTYACRFISTANASQALDASFTRVHSLNFLNCTTPAWAYSYAFPNTSIALKRWWNSEEQAVAGIAEGGDDTVFALPTDSVAFDFDCCVDRHLNISNITGLPALANGGTEIRMQVLDWDIPFHVPLSEYGSLSLRIRGVKASNESLVITENGTEEVVFASPPGVGANESIDLYADGMPLLRFNGEGVFQFAGPNVTSVKNSTGGTAGGYPISVFGENFGGVDFGPQVHFITGDGSEDTLCPTVTWHSDSHVVCEEVPAGTGAQNEVFVKVGGQIGVSSAIFTYDFPRISDVTNVPSGSDSNFFPTGGSTTITVSGTNFGTTQADVFVNISHQECPVVGVNELGTRVLCTLPAGTGGDLDLTATVNDLTSDPYLFSYNSPEIDKLTPSSSADPKGGQELVVHGSNVSIRFW